MSHVGGHDFFNNEVKMLHLFVFGLLLGWGVAIPIGAVNLEMIRRNLHYGTLAGFGLGLGACCADVTYLVLLSLGILTFLHHPWILKIIGIGGSFILTWFAYKTLRMPAISMSEKILQEVPERPIWRNIFEGYLITLINPSTIVFWLSISVTITITTHSIEYATLYASLGVLSGTLSWVIALNAFLHFTRHRLSKRVIQYINLSGGIILLLFAITGFWHAMTT